MAKGSSKGSGFERPVLKKLSLWWSNNKRDDIFWRTSQSGGRATQRMKSGCTTENSSGDACYLDAIGKPLVDLICIEMKKGYTSRGRLTKEKKDSIKTLFKNFLFEFKKIKSKKNEPINRYTEHATKQISKIFSSTKKGTGIDALDIIDGKKIKNKSLLLEFWDKCEKDRKRDKRFFSWIIFHRDQKNDCLMFDSEFMTQYVAQCGEYKEDTLTINTKNKKLHIVNLDKFLSSIERKDIEEILLHESGKKKLIKKIASKRKIKRRKK